MQHSFAGLRLAVPFLFVIMACGGGDSGGGGGKDGGSDADAGAEDGGRDAGSDAKDDDGGSDPDDSGAPDGELLEGCGDGEINVEAGVEQCDDGNARNGDGCDRQCQPETGWLCPPEGGACAPNCGDGIRIGGEACDDGNSTDGDGCSRTCEVEAGWGCSTAGMPCEAAACGDGILAGDEQCEDGNDLPGDGCDLNCQTEDGWLCVGASCSAAECGDGVRAGDEACDDGNAVSGDGCLEDCSGSEPFFTCPVLGGTCRKVTRCGDGIQTPDEACDDGNNRAGDGCAACAVEVGYACPGGRRCVAVCGDGILAGLEQCDDGMQCVGGGNGGTACSADAECDSGDCSLIAGDGCNESCRLEPGFKCETAGAPCEVAVCGNGVVEGLEECDDGDAVTGPNNDLGDGCTPFCAREPDCSGGVCQARCGDGIYDSAVEACDDGNQRDNDGCSSSCELEEGYRCEIVTQTPPAQVQIPAVYRDFKAYNFRVGRACVGGNDAGEYCTSNGTCDSGNCSSACGGDAHCCNANEPGCFGGHPDFQHVNFAASGMVENMLDAEGKPVWTESGPVFSSDSFRQWYRDSSDSRTVVDYMTLDSCPGGTCNAGTGLCTGGSANGQSCDTYFFDDQFYYPLTGRGFNDPNAPTGEFDETYADGTSGQQENFHFTSEVRYWFEYEGDEVLTFRGDDDVWVFINGQLAVDIGGVHGAANGCISLRADQSGCGNNRRTPAQLGLTVGNIYEVVVFQAERHTNRSSYRLTLAGFFTSKTECQSFCGDGILTPDELCDEGSLCASGSEDGNDCGSDAAAELSCTSGGGVCESQNELSPVPYGGCDMCLDRGPFCGDGVTDSVESCDDGAMNNDGRYEGCNPDCSAGPVCGDGNVDGFFGEQCDDGANNADGVYGACSTSCRRGPRCGDATVQSGEGEACDDGVNVSPYDGCAPGCVRAPFCGDGEVQANFLEECDDGVNDGAYGGCKANCTRAAYCGDGKVNKGAGEECDDGNANSFDGCSNACKKENVLI